MSRFESGIPDQDQMISKLTRINDLKNPHEFWSFELVATGETFYYSTGPAHDVEVVEHLWDDNKNFVGKKHVGWKTYGPTTFLSVVRGKEPDEIETSWYLKEFLSLLDGNIESKILKLLTLGEQRVDQVCYPP